MGDANPGLDSLPIAELRSRFDAQLVPARTEDMGRRMNSEFFCRDYDTRDEFIDAIRAIGQKPEAIIAHEYANGQTALAVGVRVVSYSIEFMRYYEDGNERPY